MIGVYLTTTGFQYWVVRVIEKRFHKRFACCSRRFVHILLFQNVKFVRNPDTLAIWILAGAYVLR